MLGSAIGHMSTRMKAVMLSLSLSAMAFIDSAAKCFMAEPTQFRVPHFTSHAPLSSVICVSYESR